MTEKIIEQYEPDIGRAEQKAVNVYLKSGGWLTEFELTKELEKKLSSYTGSKHAAIVSNGTAALFVALKAFKIGPGDEVIVPDFTMIATANAVVLAGAKPVFIDISQENLCLDLDLIEQALTKNTKAIICVSLNGRAPDMSRLLSLCQANNIHLIEDAAQALGSAWKGKKLGTFGEIGVFSFSPHKIITTGQGGALITNSDTLINRIRKIKDFGRIKSGVDQHITIGYNFKFTDLQATIGIEQLKRIKDRVVRKRNLFALYQDLLSNIPGVKFLETDLSQTTPWFVDVLTESRNELREFLAGENVGTRPFYPPLHTQAPYKDWPEYKGTQFAVAQEISKKGLWLPSSLTLQSVTVKRICRKIQSLYFHER